MTGVTVLIASPSDAAVERGTVRDQLSDWNINRGRRDGVALLPWLWERHAVAVLGDRPQALINAQAVDQADVVVAFFDSRLGTHTGVDVSGTAEEISRARELGKPVHVYFSTEALPRDIDPGQIAALNEFKSELEKQGLLGEYADPSDLSGQIVRAVEHDIEANGWGGGQSAPRQAGARLTWRHIRETEPRGTDGKGRIQYRTLANDLIVQNQGERDAEGLTLTVEAMGDTNFRFDGPDEPITIPAESEMSWTLIPIRTMQANGRTVKVTAQWKEGDESKEGTWTVRLG
jgi:hypothetical protein